MNAALALSSSTSTGSDSALTTTSSAFAHGGNISRKYTCQGEDISPPLYWANVPAEAKCLVLIVDDPDAPDPKAPRMTWVHWLLYNMPVNVTGLAEHMTSARLPRETKEGTNDWHRTGYGGPCPPVGRHRYFHKLYALDTVLEDLHKPSKTKLEQAMQGHIIEQAELMATFEK